MGAQPRENLAKGHLFSRGLQRTKTIGGRERAGRSRSWSTLCLPPHTHTFCCTLCRQESLRFECYVLPEFPSLKEYQIGRELPRTLTRSFRESLGTEGEGVGARFLLKWSLSVVSFPFSSTLSWGSTPKAELSRTLPPPVTPGLPSGLPPGTSSSRLR